MTTLRCGNAWLLGSHLCATCVPT